MDEEILTEEIIDPTFDSSISSEEPGDATTQADQDEELTEVIRELIEELKEDEETTEDIEEIREENITEDNLQDDTIDYSSQLSAIVTTLLDTNEEITSTNVMLEDNSVNNTLQSDINDISLTNFLLIMIFLSVLFTALLNFGRRIF